MDFTQKFQFLYTKLAEINPDIMHEKRHADKLIKVFTKNGVEVWMLVHIEVQGYKDNDFAERMFTHFYCIRDKFKKNVMALAIFTENSPTCKPNEYIYGYENTQLIYQFDIFKVLDKTEDELYLADNSFSIVMLTAKKALKTKNFTNENQLFWKMELVRKLKEQKLSAQYIRKLLYFIRYHVKFNELESLLQLNDNIKTKTQTT